MRRSSERKDRKWKLAEVVLLGCVVVVWCGGECGVVKRGCGVVQWWVGRGGGERVCGRGVGGVGGVGVHVGVGVNRF